MEAHYFDVKAWVKRFFNLKQSDKIFDNTNNSLEFIWVWSIFEHKYLKNSENSIPYNSQLIDIAEKFNFKNIDINPTYGHLHNRYLKKGEPTTFFKNLGSGKKWEKTKRQILQILKKTEPTDIEKLKVILLVLYKFRCNLFHGSKDPLLWKNFDKMFYHLNKFLAAFLDTKWTQE